MTGGRAKMAVSGDNGSGALQSDSILAVGSNTSSSASNGGEILKRLNDKNADHKSLQHR